MKTIVYDSNSRLMRFLYTMQDRYPKDTCDMKWMLFRSILFIVLGAIAGAFFVGLIGFFIAVFFIGLYQWFFVYYGNSHLGLTFVFLLFSGLAEIFLVYAFIIMRIRAIRESLEVKEPGPIAQTYKSWKEKFCSEIEVK